ncbi:hypothetical protein A20C1_04751 [marine actinobacterium PHSC20C1]|nr:hypothetical protein A20C1_04751 [marine actinobacterium PHSC20C1]
MADLYLAALRADLPSEAQALGKRAQAEIDEASQLLNDAVYNEKIVDALGTTDPKDFANAAFGALAALYPDRNLFEIDAVRKAQLTHDLGREVTSGQGAAYEISLALAQSTLDPRRFEAVIAEASRLFTSPSRLREIANEPGALPTLLRARNAIVESSMAFAATLTTAFTDEARLTRTINLYRELFECSGVPLFAWYLRVAGAKSAPLAKLFKEDSTALLAAVNRNPDLASIFVGADKNIRTAASHGFGYELVGNDVVFNTRSFEGTMTVEVVIDLLLALVESLLAAFWVLDNELTVAGIEGHVSLDNTAGTPILTVAEEFLRLLGASVASSGLTPAGWEFEVSDLAESSPHFYIEGLAGNPLEGINEITITCQHLVSGELRIPRNASAQFRDARNSSPMALVEANLILLSASTINGRSAVSAKHLRRSACVAALALLSNDDLEAIRVLRRCVALAHTVEAADVREFAESSISEWRSPESDRRKRLTETMMSWTELPAPTLPTVRTTTMTELQGHV